MDVRINLIQLTFLAKSSSMNEDRVMSTEISKEKLENMKIIESIKEYFVKIMNSQNLNNIIKKQKHPKVYCY